MTEAPQPARSKLRASAARAEMFLEQFGVRLVLSVAIIASLIPSEQADEYDLWFLALFATEVGLRVFTVVVDPHRAEPTDRLGAANEDGVDAPYHGARRRWAAIALLAVDAVALVSFLPLPVGTGGARWLRVFRLTRMLLLFGYWAPLVRDLVAILARRERARQLVLMGFVVGVLSFAGAVLLYYLSDSPVDVNGDGVVTDVDHSFAALLWWSFRQVQDPGNMMADPKALPVVLISLLLTVFGLFLVSFLIGLGTDVVHELIELTRLRPPGLRGHTVVVNIRPSTRRLLHELMRYYRKLVPSEAPLLSARWFRDLRRRGVLGTWYLVVGNQEDPPDFIRQPELSRIVYRQRPEDEEELIVRADLLLAKRIVLLADQRDPDADAETIRTMVTLVEHVRERERVHRTMQRQRVLIAEVLDESNVPAAQSALATGAWSFRGFVVPTEKLLALFIAAVVRRPGLGELLEELLTSRGHEIYTCFFDSEGLSFSMDEPPDLGASAHGAMDTLLERGLARTKDGGRVIPLGLLVARSGRPGERDFDVTINPPDDETLPRVRGFVGIADRFASIWSIASDLPSNPASAGVLPALEGDLVLPTLARTHRRKTTRILVCGFRPGSIHMLEELFRSDPGGEVLVLVRDAQARTEALSALDAHSELVKRGLMHGRHGVFERQVDGMISVSLGPEQSTGVSAMHLCVADAMASRNLVDLPAEFGHVSDLDAIIFVASDVESADKRTTTTLLKLEQLLDMRGATARRRPRVVAEVVDGRLATRLEQRYRKLGIDDVRVFSTQELRAYFLFQAVVVPGFDTVYAELLGSWGQSFVHRHVVPAAQDAEGRCSFAGLALHLRSQGDVLIAVEIDGPLGRTTLCVAPCGEAPGTEFTLSQLRGVWVVAPDHKDRVTSESPLSPSL
ncbi:MAG: ion transporter [Nannocystaceae bacterium]|nr:ion transporter [Nannocystaceae bacterium]